MSYKIYTKGNYFYIQDTDSDRLYQSKRKDVIVRQSSLIDDTFTFELLENWAENKEVSLTDIQKEDGSIYTLTEFVNFYEAKTSAEISSGKSGGSVVDLTNNDLGKDAWGKPKVVNDNSIFHGMFSFNVPVKVVEIPVIVKIDIRRINISKNEK